MGLLQGLCIAFFFSVFDLLPDKMPTISAFQIPYATQIIGIENVEFEISRDGRQFNLHMIKKRGNKNY